MSTIMDKNENSLGDEFDEEADTVTPLQHFASAPELGRCNDPMLLQSLRHQVKLSERRFDVNTLPEDIRRVYGHLEEKFGEEYALIWVFSVRTAVELHRAWHMTLLTSKILQQIKDRFQMRMTWNLGVVKLIFRVEDGAYELHRRVPYDYDSEFQDLYMKIAVAFVEGRITIHEALVFQTETKQGKHTARIGWFLRDLPGRLVLYPLEAATCAVIFFGGDWADAGVAAICGVAAGLVEFFLTVIGGDAKVLTDIMVGISTGIIGGLFYRYDGERYCLAAIFLGTLYWFFYGTAFVIGILEIVAGELETGVTRFVAVSIKTFVLTLGTTFGMKIVLENSRDAWVDQRGNCNRIDLDEEWWRIPLYLLCSASALGQYRFPLVHYWRGLAVQLVGYEVQYRVFQEFAKTHDRDFLDTAASNVTGAMAAVVAACTLSYIVDRLGYYYNARILQRDQGKLSKFGSFMFNFAAFYVRLGNCLQVGRRSELTLLKMQRQIKEQTEELRDPNHPRTEILVDPEVEAALLEAIVDAESINIWALLMPTVYQLVPGSIIARLWYNAIFPPQQIESEETIPGTNLTYTLLSPDPIEDNVFFILMDIATSLALGLLLGLGLVKAINRVWKMISHLLCCRSASSNEDLPEFERHWARRRRQRESVVVADPMDDPVSDDETESGHPKSK